MLNPNVIPRFNKDYSTEHFLVGLKSIFFNKTIELKNLQSFFNNDDIFLTNLGRTALYIILKSFNFPKNSYIGVPLYSCTVVFEAILNAGYRPYFIDINLNNYTLDPEDLKDKIDKIEAVIVIHSFGRPADMDAIKKVANGKPIIEDCAHSLLSEYKGQVTGSIGDASFFSLAKCIFAGGGGLLAINVNDDKIIEQAKYNISLLEGASFLQEVKHTFYNYIYSFLYHKPWFGLFAFSLASSLDNGLDLSGKQMFNTKKIRQSDLNVCNLVLKKYMKKMNIQREISLRMLEELENTNLFLPFEKENTFCNYYLFPVRFETSQELKKANKMLLRCGIDTAKLWGNTPLIAKSKYGYKGNCLNAEKCASTVMTIPNNYNLSENEISRIIRAIKKVDEAL